MHIVMEREIPTFIKGGKGGFLNEYLCNIKVKLRSKRAGLPENKPPSQSVKEILAA